ncbi:hypothetical protein QCA50_002383 [Cerrena zonata]|uniref:VHS domain-containing protein n=1 Tax=Cerrena zonata TaxID=2478898 RepID=A0AAW0GWU0_9APHY
MKRLFGRDKPRPPKNSSTNSDLFASEESHYSADNQYYGQAPHSIDRGQIHTQDRSPAIIRTSSDEHWDVVSSQDGSPVPTHYVPRAVSPFKETHSAGSVASTNYHDHDRQIPRRKHSATNAVAAVGILRALDPHLDTNPHPRDYPDDSHVSSHHSRSSEKKEKKGFWERASGRDKDKDKDKDKARAREKERREDDGQAELTRMIGYLTATASEDWSLVLEVSEKASSSEAAAKETAKALRREFKYAEPQAQLSAARLWAILLRNASGTFVHQCTSRKFIDTLEEVINSTRTAPVVRERLLQVLAAAAYASGSASKPGRLEKDPFRQLWRRVKNHEQPDEGIPFDANDAMFNPPLTPVPPPDLTSIPPHQRPSHTRHKSPSQPRIIPPDEDRRRLLQECKIGKGNAALLSEALTFAKPEDLKQKSIIKEFYARCRASQELIFAQIDWASANAARSRQDAGRESPHIQRKNSAGTPRPHVNSVASEPEDRTLTVEEQLLAALLSANQELTDALRVYDDLERVKIEREAERRSKKETRMNPRQKPPVENTNSSGSVGRPLSTYTPNGLAPSPTPSPSPSPPPSVVVTPIIPSHTHPLPPIPYHNQLNNQLAPQNLAPPPPAPHGPRFPSSLTNSRSRSPSPDRFIPQPSPHPDYTESTRSHLGYNPSTTTDDSSFSEVEFDHDGPSQPSAKALGKRKQVVHDDADNPFDPDDIFYEHAPDSRQSDSLSGSDSDDPYGEHKRPQVNYVYDAAAERTKQRIKEGRLAVAALETVHS